MAVRILTIPFDPNKEIFRDEDLAQFLLNKRVRSLFPEFFQLDGKAYWTVFVDYDLVLSEQYDGKDEGLDEPQKLLLQRLREWRKETAEKGGVPVYIIATNKQLMDIVRVAPRTLEALRQIHGFGKKKVEKHGKEILTIIEGFYEKKPVAAKGSTKKDMNIPLDNKNASKETV